MYLSAGLIFGTLLTPLCPPAGSPLGVDKMIIQLQSQDYRQRNAATQWLKQTPSAAAALLKAKKNADLETRRRLSAILDHYDWLAVKDLQSAVKHGNAIKFTKLLANWPKGKFDDEAWVGTRNFMCTLADLHHKKGGKKFPWQWTDEETGPRLVVARNNMDETVSDVAPGPPKGFVLLRARNVFWKEGLGTGKTIVASGSVCISTFGGSGTTVFSCGPVHCEGLQHAMLILSLEDVNLKGNFTNCLGYLIQKTHSA